ncbi:Ubiquitin-like modifier-activating enzyme atg7 [Camellia lanceoleosa]|uniref:Ubiquitin-like modifier-activating enzyme atg7 n=1 Tax=Camellia lanceoleosa TaxID=1840588 RepID=A0ACC0GJ90_9ERIC|nr:Ubiquitin-like modifier-activating enzyme atg7 [Camellia lanceoleosa]
MQRASSGQSKEAEIAEQLSKLKEDLEYVRFFPKTEKYVSLFMGGDDTDIVDRRNRLRKQIKANIIAAAASGKDLEGFYAPCSHSQVSNHLTLIAESFPPEPSEQSSVTTTSRGNMNRYSVPGNLFNTNTLEGFHALDKQSLLKAEANKVSFLYE